MSRCKICNEIIQDTFNSLFANHNTCYKCFMSFKQRREYFKIEGIEGLVLYWYEGIFKDVLFKYKGCYDYVLKDVFLDWDKEWIKRKYKGYALVLAPSSFEEEQRRDFNHLEEIFKVLRLPIVKCFYKSKKWKQSDKKGKERELVKNVIKIDLKKLGKVNKVLIVDDVLTSGSTIKTMIRQLPAQISKKVLILSSNCRFKTNEFS